MAVLQKFGKGMPVNRNGGWVGLRTPFQPVQMAMAGNGVFPGVVFLVYIRCVADGPIQLDIFPLPAGYASRPNRHATALTGVAYQIN